MTPDPTLVEDRHEIDAQSLPIKPADQAEWYAGAPRGHGDGSGELDNGSLPLLFVFVGVILAIGYFRSWWFPGIVAGLLFMLFMHELGHFVTARLSGMKVTEFFLGFGPKIWSFNRGETEYGVKAIPAGAYVRIMGMTNLDEIDPAEEHRTYRSQPYWQRMMTICAGSAMHFVMATIALFVLFASFSYQGFNGPPWFVNMVVDGSTASSLGIQPGDQIESINDDRFANWDEFGQLVSELEEGPVEIVLTRDGEQLTLSGDLGLRPEDVLLDGFGLSLLVEDPAVGLEVGYIWPQDQADQFGIELGDVILSADDVARPSPTALADLLRDRDGETVTFEILRDGDTVTLSDRVDLNTSTPFRGFFGVGPVFVPEPEPGAVESVELAVNDFGVISKTNVVGIADLVNPSEWLGLSEPEVQRRASLIPRQGNGAPVPQSEDGDTNRPLSIVGIGRLISESESTDQVLFLFAVVNIFIGLFNLVPLLPLDGGHAAIATYERLRQLVTGKPHRVDAAKLVPITWLVIMLLVAVGIWTTVLDIFSWPG